MLILNKNIKRLLLTFAAFSLLGSQAYSQKSEAELIRERDSILNLASKEPDSPKTAERYYNAADKSLSLYEYQKSADYARKSLDLAKVNRDSIVLLNDYLLLGHIHVLYDDPLKALECYLSAKKILEKQGDVKRGAEVISQIGLVYFNRGHYARAAERFSEALDIYKTLDDEKNVIDNTKYLAACNSKLGKYDEAAENYQFLLKKFRENDDWDNTKMIYQRLNEIYRNKEDFDNIYKYNYDLYNLCLEKNDIKESLNAMNNIAYCYVCMKKYDKAVKFYEQLLVADNSVDNSEEIAAGTYTSLGLCYQNMDNFDAAVENLSRASAIRHKLNKHNDASTVDDIMALIYIKEKDLHNAEYRAIMAVEEAEKYRVDGGDDDGELRKEAYMTYNKVLTLKGDDKNAMVYYKKYLSLRDSSQTARELYERKQAEDLRHLTDLEQKYMKDLDEEEIAVLSKQQLQLLAENRQKEIDLLTKNNEIQEMEKKRMEQSLVLAHKEQEALRKENEIRELQQQQKLAEEEIKRKQLEENERQNQIELLKQQQENQDLVIANQQKEARQMRLLIYMGAAMILFFVVVFFMMRKKNKKLKEQQKEIERKNEALVLKNEEITMQKENLEAANNEIMNMNNELTKQKAIVEEANKSITDSIVYAQRIQTAVCPSPTFLDAFKLEHFLFFRPRDIVSGDYYWFYTDNIDSIFIVAADCTGHGVPGAFMSMLGVSLFNKVVGERNVFEPGDILTELRQEVKEALHQDSIVSSQKDGMDLSLIRYDMSSQMITFAGANNNGYLVQRFSKEEEALAREGVAREEFLRKTDGGFLKLTVMPADAMPIGIYIREKERFSQVSYKIRKGDSIYMTSDGYIDQFGGKYGRKFLTKNFEKMLLDINLYSLERQKQIVAETHDNWKGSQFSQLDDVIVMGIRF
ncbi:MAG: tetratricopeptide repeat protein [Bacteroidales bacterium]|nr:tetratricopeptide repeat protein [Bacteroidales bacterium]